MLEILKQKKLLKGDVNNCGYYRVRLETKNRRKRYFRHRLVAEHFIFNDDIEHKIQVNHIDGDKSNNTINNLEWVTPSQNDKHAFDIGLKQLTHNKPFIVIFNDGHEEYFESTTQLSNKLNISYATVSLWLNKKINTYHNYGIKELYYK